MVVTSAIGIVIVSDPCSAQTNSYEVTIGLNMVGIFMIFGSLQLNDIIWGQGELIGGWLPKWGIVVQPLGFVLFMAAAVA